MGKIVIATSLALMLLSCHQKTEMTYDFPREYELAANIYDDELFVEDPEMVLVADSLIVLASYGINENFGGVYNARNNMVQVASFGAIGRGPAEFLQPVMTSSFDNKFIILDRNKSDISVMELTNNNGVVSVSQIENNVFSSSENRESYIHAEKIIRVSDKYYAGMSGYAKDAFFSLFDDKLNFIEYFGDAPFGNKLPNYLLHPSTVDPSSFVAGNGLIVYAPYLVHSVTCYKPGENGMVKSWEDHYAPTYYHIDNSDITYDNNKTIIGCTGAYVTGRYIYLLVDYTTKDEIKDRNAGRRAKDVLIYDLDGNRIARIHLDLRPAKIAVSDDDKTLYGYLRTEDKFVSYDLPL